MNKRLYKSENKVFTGVCGGIAEYFNMDPTIIRFIIVIIACCSFGTVFVAYIVASFIMPSKPIDNFDNLRSANEDSDYEYHSSSKSKKSSKGSTVKEDVFDSYFEKDKE